MGAVDGLAVRRARPTPSATSGPAGKHGKLVAEVRHAGKVVGRAETTLDADGAPLKARLVVPSVPAKLDLTFLSTARADFAPDIWTARRP